MKTFIQISKVFFLSLLVANCSSSDDSQPTVPVVIPPSVNTLPAEVNNALSITLNGNITAAGNVITEYGFCVSTEANPSIENGSTTSNYANHSGAFSQTINLSSPHTVYHARAFVKAIIGFSTQTFYGNDVTFTTDFPIEALATKNIQTNVATFSINVLHIPDNIEELGVCYGTIESPTTSNSEKLQFPETTGFHEGNNNTYFDELTPNTVYYARPYYMLSNGMTYYGQQMSFRTTGYFGPGGGYVAYDKGVTTEGWRYLEVSPTALLYNGSSPKWGCYNTFITNTYPEMGTGVSNTNVIAAGCSAADCAARLCYNLVRNGQSDWYLGSRDEMLTVVQSLQGINVNIQNCWTSSETTASEAYYITSSANDVMFASLQPKYYGYNVFPIRRY